MSEQHYPQLGKRIQDILARDTSTEKVHGAAAIVCRADGNIAEGAAGLADEHNTPMTVDTCAAIMSLTKGITAVAAMQLVERGQLSLDDEAGQYCPWLAEVQVLDGTSADGSYRFRPPTTPITIRHLLTHTSGLTYTVWNKPVYDWAKHPDTIGPENSASISSIQLPLAFDPGSDWAYGVGMDWVGLVVEAVSGQDLESFFRDNILDPLNMNNTSFNASAAMKDGAMRCYHRTSDGALNAGNNSVIADRNREFNGGGGDLLGTTADYSRFLRMMLGLGQLDGARVLKEDTVRLMSQNHIGEKRIGALTSQLPAVSNDVEFFPGDKKSWALSFQRNEVPSHTGRPAGTLMWAGLMNCYYWIDILNNVAGVYVSQVLPFGDEVCLAQYYDIETATYQQLSSGV